MTHTPLAILFLLVSGMLEREHVFKAILKHTGNLPCEICPVNYSRLVSPHHTALSINDATEIYFSSLELLVNSKSIVMKFTVSLLVLSLHLAQAARYIVLVDGDEKFTPNKLEAEGDVELGLAFRQSKNYF